MPGSVEARSRATGSVHVDLPPGAYRVTLQKPGFGAKSVQLDIRAAARRTSSGCCPTACSATPGRSGSGRGRGPSFASTPSSRTSWSSGGTAGQGVRPQASAGSTSTARGRRCRSRPTAITRRPASSGTSSATPTRVCTSTCVAPERCGLYYFHARTAAGAAFFVPLDRGAGAAAGAGGRAGLEHHLERLQQLRRPQQLHPCRPAAGRADGQRPAGAEALHRPGRHRPTTPTTTRRCRSTGPSRSTTSTRAQEITDPIEGRAACHVAPAEWRLLGWLEREGFAYDYYAETQLHDGTLDLDAYRVLVISHAPGVLVAAMYSGGQGVGVRAGRAADVPGRQRPELRGRIHRSHDGDLPQRRWPRLEARGLRKPLPHAGRVGGNLLGVVFTRTGIMTGAPYRVLDAAHWAFAGTGLEDGDLFGRDSLHMRCPGGASGHETDKVSPSSPAGRPAARQGHEPRRRRGRADLLRDAQRRRGLLGRLDHLAQRDPGRRARVADHGQRDHEILFIIILCDVGSMQITRLEAIPVRVPLKAGMVTKTAHGDHHTSDYVIVKLHTDQGLIGLGEATVSALWSGETAQGCVAAIRDLIAPALVGRDPFQINAAAQVDGLSDQAQPVHQGRRSRWRSGTSPARRLGVARLSAPGGKGTGRHTDQDDDRCIRPAPGPLAGRAVPELGVRSA